LSAAHGWRVAAYLGDPSRCRSSLTPVDLAGRGRRPLPSL